jgi:hypothetical protein
MTVAGKKKKKMVVAEMVVAMAVGSGGEKSGVAEKMTIW